MKNEELKFNPNRSVASHCPCGLSNHDGKFSPFIGYTDKGHCFSCGSNFMPDLQQKKASSPKPKIRLDNSAAFLADVSVKQKISFIDEYFYTKSLCRYNDNALYRFLVKLTSEARADSLRREYLIGTSLQRRGSTVFWLADVLCRIRSGKIIQYQIREDATSSIKLNCNRIKENKPPVTWVHKLIGKNKFNFQNCFYGEHLLNKYPEKQVGIVESEKSAIIAAAYFPDYLWLACGGADGLTMDKVAVLEDRKVILFPDLKKYDAWKGRAKYISAIVPNCTTKVSDMLERRASDGDRNKGCDLADYLIREDYKTFVNP